MTKPRKIALAGIGKIARASHIPALNASDRWELAATMSRSEGVEGIDNYQNMEEFLKARDDIDTVSLALPPAPRFDYAAQALRAGRNVMLEKPPGVTLAECRRLEEMAEEAGVTLYASWHSRMGPAVAETARRLERTRLHKLHVDWREDVREWHPGQDWIWEAGNLGVFDPGINAMSILVLLLPGDAHLTRAHMKVPEGAETPIAADLAFAHETGAEMTATLDWRHDGEAIWDIVMETEAGRMVLRGSGGSLEIDGEPIETPGPLEYEAVYAHFADLLDEGRSDVDLRPMIHVADAFLLASREVVAPFEW